jgi:hypothetical protein
MKMMRSMASAISARHGGHAFLNQLLDAVEGRGRAVGVNGGDPAGMPGVPGLEHIEGFGAADLADHDAVGPQA